MMTPAMQATQPQNIPQTTALLMDMKNKGTLQSYVAQHKDDPGYYALLSLATTINQTSDEARALATHPQPRTVSDTALAALGPRQMAMPAPAPQTAPQPPQQPPQQMMQAPQQAPAPAGLEQLPAQNLHAMSDGGIAGYAEGGKIDEDGVKHFQVGGMNQSVSSAADLYNLLGLNGTYPNTGATSTELPNYKFTPSGAEPTPTSNVKVGYGTPNLSNVLGGAGAAAGPLSLLYGATAFDDPKALEAARKQEANLPQAEKDKLIANRNNWFGQLFGGQKPAWMTAPAAPSAQATNTAQPAATDQTGTPDQKTDTSAKPWTPPQMALPSGVGVPSLLNTSSLSATDAKKAASQFFDAKKIEDQHLQDKKYVEDMYEKDATERAEMLKNRPLLGDKEEKRLNAEEARDVGKRQDLAAMSWLEAGLATLGGTSPWATVNLSKASEGVKSYKEGIKDLEKAKQARDQAYSHIEEIRDARTIQDQDAEVAAHQNYRNALMNLQGHYSDAKNNFETANMAAAKDVYTNSENNAAANARTNAQVQAQTSIANAQIKAQAMVENFKAMQPPEQIRAAQWLGNGNLDVGLQKLNELTKDKSGVSLLNAWQSNNTKLVSAGQPEISFDAFVANLPKAQLALQSPVVANQVPPGTNNTLPRPGVGGR